MGVAGMSKWKAVPVYKPTCSPAINQSATGQPAGVERTCGLAHPPATLKHSTPYAALQKRPKNGTAAAAA